MTLIIGFLLGILLFAPKQDKREDNAMYVFQQAAVIMTRQATHAQRLKLLYDKMPVYNVKFFQAMMTCEPFMQPEAKVYVANLMNEYNALIADIADAMEDFKNDSIEIEQLFVEV